MEAIVGGDELDPADRLDLVDLGRRNEVIQDRVAAAEALDTEELLRVEAAIGRPVLGVPLAGQAAVGDVVHEELASSGRGGQSRHVRSKSSLERYECQG